MIPGKIVIAGGTGFVGKYIASRFRAEGKEVFIISRQPEQIQWTDMQGITGALEHAEMLINLAGKSVNCRYTEKNKNAIMSSRTGTTKILGEAVLKCKVPPKIWINAGTATIYRHAEDRPMSEATGEIGKGFSVDVAKNWEKTFFDFNTPQTRQVVLRMAIVLGKTGGVIKPLKNLVRAGLGGKQGKGTQMFSWIHIADLYQVILFIQSSSQISGVINCAAPTPVTNEALMSEFRKVMHVKIALPAPEWLLKIGAVIIRTETELIFKSRWVIPERLLNAGFKFLYPTIYPALKNLLTT